MKKCPVCLTQIPNDKVYCSQLHARQGWKSRFGGPLTDRGKRRRAMEKDLNFTAHREAQS